MRKSLTGMPIEGSPVPQYEFRRAAEEDVPNVVNLLKDTILKVYSQILPEDRLEPWVEGDRLSSDVNSSWQNMIVAEKAGEVVGVAARFGDLVGLIWVHPAHQREGIGGALLDLVEAEIKRSGYKMAKLQCFSDNDRAVGFYQAKGWKLLCEEMDEEAGALKMVMTKTLAKESRCG